MTETAGRERWMSINDAAEFIGLSRATLYSYMSDGRLPFYYIKGSNQRRIKQSDLDALFVRGRPEDAVGADDSEE